MVSALSKELLIETLQVRDEKLVLHCILAPFSMAKF